MAIKEQDKVFYEELANGDKVINLPVTRANNVEGLGRSANTAYAEGDVVYTDNNNKVTLKCITAGTTSVDELDISTNNIGDTVTDGSVVWQVCNRTSDVTSVNGKTGDVVVDLPVGHIYWSVEPNVPTGRLPALGATYNRALYADLWAWANSVGLVKSEAEWQAIASANNGNCTYYSSGDGSSTFRVPKLPTTIASDVPSEVPVVGNGMTLGLDTGVASIPNLGLTGHGAQYLIGSTGTYGTPLGTGGSGSALSTNVGIGITTDPTKSGIVAQTSATKITGQWLIVAFGVAHNIGEADVADVMQAVEQVQTSVGNIKDTHYVPNYAAAVNITFPTSSAKYTAPSDGIYFTAWWHNRSSTSTLYINNVAVLAKGQYSSACENSGQITTIPLVKGDVIYWDRSPNSNGNYMNKFVPYKEV